MDGWCAATGELRGEVLTLARVWTLALAWYGDRLAPDFRSRTVAEALGIFGRLGLTSPFWQALDE